MKTLPVHPRRFDGVGRARRQPGERQVGGRSDVPHQIVGIGAGRPLPNAQPQEGVAIAPDPNRDRGEARSLHDEVVHRRRCTRRRDVQLERLVFGQHPLRCRHAARGALLGGVHVPFGVGGHHQLPRVSGAGCADRYRIVVVPVGRIAGVEGEGEADAGLRIGLTGQEVLERVLRGRCVARGQGIVGVGIPDGSLRRCGQTAAQCERAGRDIRGCSPSPPRPGERRVSHSVERTVASCCHDAPPIEADTGPNVSRLTWGTGSAMWILLNRSCRLHVAMMFFACFFWARIGHPGADRPSPARGGTLSGSK